MPFKHLKNVPLQGSIKSTTRSWLLYQIATSPFSLTSSTISWPITSSRTHGNILSSFLLSPFLPKAGRRGICPIALMSCPLKLMEKMLYQRMALETRGLASGISDLAATTYSSLLITFMLDLSMVNAYISMYQVLSSILTFSYRIFVTLPQHIQIYRYLLEERKPR